MSEELPQTEEQQIAIMWAEHDREMVKYYNNCNRINNRMLRAIKSIKGESFYSDLMSVIEWAEPSGVFGIVNEPSGDMQSEDYGSIQRVWVDQWSVGDSGDRFSGYVYVKLRLKKFLKMYFEC